MLKISTFTVNRTARYAETAGFPAIVAYLVIGRAIFGDIALIIEAFM